ncbi:hypothetical protein [Niastella yeongjuensis]|uniref:hypothetical protein n=1 Tax=Niastella yeongjuensis TaxID=354355 RepID=UPI0008ACB30A|nr:hypothetical protein [Niastella yeongjuensis]SEO87566.1 hypothetical protein SAMN05660816_03813 [Niastella yeongjuensis]
MKTIFTLTTLVLIVIASFVSAVMFKFGNYNFSALLVLTSFLSSVLWIHVVNSKKVILR